MEDGIRLKIILDLDGKIKKYFHLVEKDLYQNGVIKQLKQSLREKILTKKQLNRLTKLSLLIDDFNLPNKEFIRIIHPDECINLKVHLDDSKSNQNNITIVSDVSSVSLSKNMHKDDLNNINGDQPQKKKSKIMLEEVVSGNPFGNVHKSIANRMSSTLITPNENVSHVISQNNFTNHINPENDIVSNVLTAETQEKLLEQPLKYKITKKVIHTMAKSVGTLLGSLSSNQNDSYQTSFGNINGTNQSNMAATKPNHIKFNSSTSDVELEESYTSNYIHKNKKNDTLLSNKYSNLVPVTTFPKKHDRLAFKMRELSAITHCPEISPYLEGTVVDVNENDKILYIDLDDEYVWTDNDGTFRAFNIFYDQEDEDDSDLDFKPKKQIRNKHLTIIWKNLIEPKYLTIQKEL